MAKGPRVRFAPSPTGEPHIGNIRTALFNWLFARHYGGSFILRIEDTDVERKVPGAIESILESLRWLGLEWDEGPEVGGPFGPYTQSDNRPLYQEMARKLVDSGWAYYCYCFPERLERMRAEQRARKEPPRYDRHCREMGEKEKPQGTRPVIRFKTPLEGETTCLDLLRGRVSFQNSTLDDFVLLKSDGYPTYHLANIVDDHRMEITHVLRADEWLPSTPRHILLYNAFGFPPPQFAHLPMILGKDKAKLSKRHGATSVLAYRKEGYLPEAMVNFLALLGWSLDDRTELLSREELIAHFSLERIGVNPAIFNLEKLTWMNGVYLRHLSPNELTERALPFLEAGLPLEVPRPLDKAYALRVLSLLQERARTLAELPALGEYFFQEELTYNPSHLQGGMTSQEAARALEIARERLSALPHWEEKGLEDCLRPLAGELGQTTGAFFGLLRVALTGRTASPPLFQTMAVLGRERCLKRLAAAHHILAAS